MRDHFFYSVMCWILVLSISHVHAQGLSSVQPLQPGSKQVIIKLAPSLSSNGLESIDRGATYSSLSATEQVNFIQSIENITGHSVSHVREMWGRADVFSMDGFTHQQEFADTLNLLNTMSNIRFAHEDTWQPQRLHRMIHSIQSSGITTNPLAA